MGVSPPCQRTELPLTKGLIMHRNRSVNVHQFAMVPKAEIPRSSFDIQKTHKTTFDAGLLVPVYVNEVLPGDTFRLSMTAFARLATPLFPIMDNMYLDSFFFFVPNRLVWDNWKRFNGEQRNPGDSTSFVIPQIVSKEDGYDPLTIYDYMGLPTEGQIMGGETFSHNALPLRAYNLIWNEWFRDQNLQDSVATPTTDGPDLYTNYTLLRRGKRHDYFTSALPWPQKGESVSIPLLGDAPVRTSPTRLITGIQDNIQYAYGNGTIPLSNQALGMLGSDGTGYAGPAAPGVVSGVYPSNLYADLSAATAATINQLRQSFQVQKLLERDARGGTRYTEIIRAHFGVVSPDARLQRPEYLGGGSTPVNINPIAQTSATDSGTPLGELGAMGTALAKNHGFTQSFTEHGYVIGLVSVRADLTYQQGLRRMWSRSTRYDFYWPAFAMLGEQAVLNKEIYCVGNSQDDQVFGYQERWAEYRYDPSQISGLFKSTTMGTIDPWHLAQRFTALPVLGNAFIQDTPPVERIVAVGAEANGQQFLFDSFFDLKAARPLPMYSVPGLIDHF